MKPFEAVFSSSSMAVMAATATAAASTAKNGTVSVTFETKKTGITIGTDGEGNVVLGKFFEGKEDLKAGYTLVKAVGADGQIYDLEGKPLIEVKDSINTAKRPTTIEF